MMQESQRSPRKRRIALSALAVVLLVAVGLDRANQIGMDAATGPSSSPRDASLQSRTDRVRAAAMTQTLSDPAATESRPAPPQATRRLDAEVLSNPFGALGAVAVAAAPTVPAVAAQKPASVPVPVVVPAAPVAPTAPPLPFTAVGLIAGAEVTEGQPIAFLRQQEQVLLVKVGDDIAKTYRVESISAERIEFTFLPLQQRQILTLAQ